LAEKFRFTQQIFTKSIIRTDHGQE